MPGERADVAEVMRRLHGFVLPLLAEGISNTILEAMATGLPVVAIAVGGNAELVAHGRSAESQIMNQKKLCLSGNSPLGRLALTLLRKTAICAAVKGLVVGLVGGKQFNGELAQRHVHHLRLGGAQFAGERLCP